MNKSLLVFLCWLFPCLHAFANEDTLHLSREFTNADLSQYAWVKNQSTQQLEKWTRPSLNFGMYNGQVELHFFLQWDSSTATNTPYFLALENQGVDSIRIRCITDSGIQTLPTIGREISYHVRGNHFRYFVWPLTNSKTHQLEIVANCFVFYHSLQLPFSLHTRQHYYEKENQINFLLGFCFGTALLMLLVVLFLYISSRERHLIYYALHIVFMLLWQLSYYGFFAAYLWPEKPYLNFYGHYTCGSLAAIFQITFMLIYFQIKPPHNVYYVFNTLRWMFIAIVIPVAVLRISNHWLFQVPAFFYIALLFLYIATILYYLIIADKKLIEVRVLIAAASVVGALSMLRVFEVAGITNSSLLVSHSITIGQYFEMLIFTGGLAYSFAVYKKNYIKKIIEFNELQKAHYESTIQLIDDERNRIAADLHDMLGSQLAGIKLKTQLTYPHHESTAEIVTDLDDAYSQLRTLAKDLKTIDWDFYSVYETLEAKVQYLNSISSIQFQLTTPKPDERFLQTNAKRHLHAIASELLLNVLKHAQATHCMISLTNPSEGNIQLDIRDNGRDAVIDFQKGIGLTNIQERINGLGGEISFRSEDAGFTVSVML